MCVYVRTYVRTTHVLSRYAKATCAVLHLDGAAGVRHAVDVLKSQLLRLLGVRDFSPESVWRDPSLEFVLRDVMCDYCKRCEDLDLCRNPALIKGSDNPAERWKCEACQHPYDLFTVEHRLVDQVCGWVSCWVAVCVCVRG